jgi:hypothetical protein
MRPVLLIGALLYALPLLATTPIHYAKPMAVKDGPPLSKSMLAGRGGKLHGEVAIETSASIFIFPVVGSVAGGNHTYYRSEATIINNRSISQTVEMFYFAQGVSNCTRPSKFVRLQANSWSAYDDILQDVFGETGIGSLIVQAVDDNGNYDQNGDIDGTSRIWTPSPFSDGTLSQTFPAASFNQSNGTMPLSAYGLRDGSGFHTNMGVLNYANQPRTFTVLINGVNGLNTFDFDVNSCSFEQFRIPDGNYGIMQLQVTAHDSLGQWYGYGSSVDEATANNWSSVLR